MIERAEWERRFKARIIEKADVSEGVADDELRAGPFGDIYEGFENDPEGAADMSMSYWEPD